MCNDPFASLAVFVVERLPDSVTKRKELLEALRLMCPMGHPLSDELTKLRFHLDMHEITQRELPLAFVERKGK